MKYRVLLSGFLLSALLQADPMGSSSVNHYARIEVAAHGLRVQYVLHLAETATQELLQNWQLHPQSPQAALESKAREEAGAWVRNLSFRVNGRSVEPRLENTSVSMENGGLRVTSMLSLGVAAGELEYEDRNYPGRTGWKEIVITAGPGASLTSSSASDRDRSHGLTSYPPDAAAAPPQDLKARLNWTVENTTSRSPFSVTPASTPQ